jgi:hypothetical protein
VKPKDVFCLTSEVLQNYSSFFMALGPTAKEALSNTLNTGSLNYNTNAVMKKNMEIK